MLIFRRRVLFPQNLGEDIPLAVREPLLAVWKIFLYLLAIEKHAAWFMNYIDEWDHHESPVANDKLKNECQHTENDDNPEG